MDTGTDSLPHPFDPCSSVFIRGYGTWLVCYRSCVSSTLDGAVRLPTSGKHQATKAPKRKLKLGVPRSTADPGCDSTRGSHFPADSVEASARRRRPGADRGGRTACHRVLECARPLAPSVRCQLADGVQSGSRRHAEAALRRAVDGGAWRTPDGKRQRPGALQKASACDPTRPTLNGCLIRMGFGVMFSGIRCWKGALLLL